VPGESTGYLPTSPVTQSERTFYAARYKRLSKGRFPWWPQNPSGTTQTLEAHQLGVLLSGGDPAAAPGVPPWRRVDVRLRPFV
jgi:hypothetical protein